MLVESLKLQGVCVCICENYKLLEKVLSKSNMIVKTESPRYLNALTPTMCWLKTECLPILMCLLV